MGTSTSYGGPTGSNPLLPPWADNPEDIPLAAPAPAPTDEKAEAPTPGEEETPDHAVPPPLPAIADWRPAKRAMSALGRSGVRSDAKIRKVGSRFVSALGGSRRAAASSPGGRNTAQLLGGFLADVHQQGIHKALERIGVADYRGQPIGTLLVAIGRAIAPSGAMVEDAIAAGAFHETMALLVEQLDVDGADLDAFDRMDEALIREAMRRYICTYVSIRLLHVLAAGLEGGNVTAVRAHEIECEIRDYVESSTTLNFGDAALATLDWGSAEAKLTVDRLFREGYEVFGGFK